MLLNGLAEFVSSLIGTVGFAIIFNAPRRAWLPSAAIGALGFVIYWVMIQMGIGEPSAMFAASLIASVLAQICAKKMKMIATVFVALSIIPLVPGLGLYRCLASFATREYTSGMQTLVSTMISFVMIALGLAVGSIMYKIICDAGKKIHDKRLSINNGKGNG